MPEVPVEYLTVPRYSRRITLQEDDKDADAWIVSSKVDPNKSVKLWIRPEFHQKLQAIYPQVPGVDDIWCRGGFVKGRAMRDIAVTINTFAGSDRPAILYRVVHDGQPHYGMKARGCGIVCTDPLYFQILVQKHICWRCRDPSPFMSVTSSQHKVIAICTMYYVQGFTGIKVIKFKSSGPGWDHKVQRLWRTTEICRSLKLTAFPYLEFDYLLEDSIPKESIIECKPWNEAVQKYDPNGWYRYKAEMDQKRCWKRKRELDEEVEAGKGTEVSDEHQILDTSATLVAESAGASDRNDTVDDSGLDSESDEDQVVVKKYRGRKRTTEFKLRI